VRDLVKASFITWIGAAATILAALVRGKVFAVELGPVGVGTVSQLFVFVSAAGLVGSFTLGSGIAQYVAQFTGEGAREDIRRVVQTSIALTLILGMLLAVVVWFTASQWSRWLFNGDAGYANYIRLFSLVIVAFSLAPTLQSVLNGLGEAFISSGVEILLTPIIIVTVVFLLKGWKIEGAILFFTLIAFLRVGCQVAALFRKHRDIFLGFFRFIDRRAIRQILTGLLKIAIGGVIIQQSDAAAQVFVRTRIIQLYSLEVNGLYQASFATAQQVLIPAMAFISTYAFSKVNSSKTSQERTQYTNEALQLSLLIVVSGISAIILFKHAYIILLLSPKFLRSESLFPFQAAGEGFRQLGLAVGMAMLLTSGVVTWVVVGLIWAGGNAIFALVFLPLGFWALPLHYLAGGFVYFIVSWAVMSRNDQFAMNLLNKQILFISLFFLALLALLPFTIIGITLGLLLLFIWLLFALGHYRHFVIGKLKRIFSAITANITFS